MRASEWHALTNREYAERYRRNVKLFAEHFETIQRSGDPSVRVSFSKKTQSTGEFFVERREDRVLRRS
jgi:hypothetical protein